LALQKKNDRKRRSAANHLQRFPNSYCNSAFFDSTDWTRICDEYQMAAQLKYKSEPSATTANDYLSMGTFFDSPVFLLDNTFKKNSMFGRF
jgi:hypothetical protein